MMNLLYNLFIAPIQIVVEMTYSMMNTLIHNKGLSIIAVSIVIQTLVLPLYKRADAIQAEETKKQQNMAEVVSHIKRTFKGDERFMMLQTYYRQQHYKTWYSLRNTISIMLQIPFFIAAYNYLSTLQELSGVKFLFISDLSKPDNVFSIGGFAINILPILMTCINIISGIIYTKGQPLRAKIQVYGLALIFLVLLYSSPAGLVLYWTMNNAYSFMKNAIGKLGLFKKKTDNSLSDNTAANKSIDVCKKHNTTLFLSEVCLTLLMGALIPISVIQTSATEFVVEGISPVSSIINNVEIYAGLFIVWFSVFYYLTSKKSRHIFCYTMLGIYSSAILNFTAYGNSGNLSEFLVYQAKPEYTVGIVLINTLICAACVTVVILLYIRFKGAVNGILTITMVSLLVISVTGLIKISKDVEVYTDNQQWYAHEDIIPMSTKGKNVVVIMMDRLQGAYEPYIFEEHPEIADEFGDFTYFPNTMSYGNNTRYSTPSLFGGYEYTPQKINSRPNKLLRDEQNEALKLLPCLFSEKGYNVTVCDPPYAGYQFVPDLTIYDDLKNTEAYITEGAFDDKRRRYTNRSSINKQRSHLIYYSMARTVPRVLFNIIYNEGEYLTREITMGEAYIKAYTALESLPEMTEIVDDNSNNLLMFQNSLPHEYFVMKTPEYIPTDDYYGTEELKKDMPKESNGRTLVNEGWYDLAAYHVNVASYKLLGEWIQYLKDNKVYDNTRIIICSDHGYGTGQIDELLLDDGTDIMHVNPVLMIKDFNADGYEVSGEFMTCADMPSLALAGLIDNPVNPYTGNLINDDSKFTDELITVYTSDTGVDGDRSKIFKPDEAKWYKLTNNDIYDKNNWELIDVSNE